MAPLHNTTRHACHQQQHHFHDHLNYHHLIKQNESMHKIVHHLNDIFDRDSFIILADTNSTRNSTFKIFKPGVTASWRAKFVSGHCINAGNYLHKKSVRTANSIFTFKNNLDSGIVDFFLLVLIFQLQH